jgi:hypothetical protein
LFRVTATAEIDTALDTPSLPDALPIFATNANDVSYNQAQTSQLRSWGDKLCAAGLG